VTKRLFVPLVAVVGLAAVVFFAFGASLAKSEFAHKWTGVFRACKTLDDIKHLGVYVREFPDGSWIAAANTSPSDNRFGYFANAFRDSHGRIFTAEHDFDGYEGLAGELSEVDARSVDDFFAKTKDKFHFIEQSLK
jgi:hypothetical protein